MKALITENPLFGITITIFAYWIGLKANQKLKKAVVNPLLIAVVLIVAVMLIFDIPYSAFNQGGVFINMFLIPITTMLAVSIYRERATVKRMIIPIFAGTLAGSAASLISITILAKLLGLTPELHYTLLPKSVTTPIAVAISESLGGIRSLTVIALLITGVLGNILAPSLTKLFRVKSRVAAGVAIGTASHVVGTSKALEMGEDIGAMSGIALSFSGIITAILVSIFF